MKRYERSMFIFRRDLRIQDNIGLYRASLESELVIPLFIFDPKQVGDANQYKSDNAIQFMIESLRDLEQQITQKGGMLQLCYGDTLEVFETIIQQEKSIQAVYLNRDYTPFSSVRDKKIEQLCAEYSLDFHSWDDVMLFRPEDAVTKQKTPFRLFTPFFKSVSLIPVAAPKKIVNASFYTKRMRVAHSDEIYKKIVNTVNKNSHSSGGTACAKKLLKKLSLLVSYPRTRNIPSIETTNLSAHIKFGTVSIREVYHAVVNVLGGDHDLIRQLYWRDFFTYVAFHSPRVFGNAYQEKYNHLQWENDKKKFARWCEGNTGFPIVDAGMRQMNITGYMHNRVRMIVASFLIKDLHIDWRWGEKYFAQQLIDYDPCVNNGNWQWVASTGCDAQPYFRIFNPWLQQKKFDPHCEYIKRWIPELREIDNATIHSWVKKSLKVEGKYPAPMVDHQKESMLAKQLYKRVS